MRQRVGALEVQRELLGQPSQPQRDAQMGQPGGIIGSPSPTSDIDDPGSPDDDGEGLTNEQWNAKMDKHELALKKGAKRDERGNRLADNLGSGQQGQMDLRFVSASRAEDARERLSQRRLGEQKAFDIEKEFRKQPPPKGRDRSPDAR